MRKSSILQFCLAAFVACLFFSCSKQPNNEVEYFAFLETKDGDWGLVAPDGKVLCKECFESAPTIVRDGRFFVRNKQGYWQLYEAAAQPKLIGKEYLQATAFRKGHALVVEKNKPVSIINTKGQTVKVLDKLAGKTVDVVSKFDIYGYALFQTTDTLVGLINHEGECVVKPEYLSLNYIGFNKYVGVSKKYKNKESKKYSIITTEGKVLFELSSDRYKDVGYFSADGYMPVAVERNDQEIWGLLNEKGEEVLKPSKRFEKIGFMVGKSFPYQNDGKWGVMNLEGETQIFAKYNLLLMMSENELIAVKDEDGKRTCKFINAKDEPLSPDTYLDAYQFDSFDGKHTLVKPDDHAFTLIDRDYKTIKEQPDMIDVDFSEGDDFLKSDYVDLDQFIGELQLKKESIQGLGLQTKPAEAVALAVKLGAAPGNDAHKAGDPYWYDYTQQLQLTKNLTSTDVYLDIYFDGKMSEWVYGANGTSTYKWKSPKVVYVSLTTPASPLLANKMSTLFEKVKAIYQKDATVVKQNKRAVIYRNKQGDATIVIHMKNVILVQLLSEEIATKQFVDSYDIDPYKDLKEDLCNPRYADSEAGDEGSGNADVYGEEPVIDSVADSAVVDSMVADW